MNERERVAELVMRARQNTINVLHGDCSLISNQDYADQIDALYSEREKKMREALEWACIRICADARGIQCDEIHCPIKQGREGK